jgi:hypothetical protein
MFLTTTLLMPASIAQAETQEIPQFFFAEEVDVPFFGTEEAGVMSGGSHFLYKCFEQSCRSGKYLLAFHSTLI